MLEESLNCCPAVVASFSTMRMEMVLASGYGEEVQDVADMHRRPSPSPILYVVACVSAVVSEMLCAIVDQSVVMPL